MDDAKLIAELKSIAAGLKADGLVAASEFVSAAEGRLTALTTVSEQDVERATAAMFRHEAWSSFWSARDAAKLARAALTAFMER